MLAYLLRKFMGERFQKIERKLSELDYDVKNHHRVICSDYREFQISVKMIEKSLSLSGHTNEAMLNNTIDLGCDLEMIRQQIEGIKKILEKNQDQPTI